MSSTSRQRVREVSFVRINKRIFTEINGCLVKSLDKIEGVSLDLGHVSNLLISIGM